MTTDATSALRALADELRRLADDIARAGIKGFGNRATMIADELDAALTADAADGVRDALAESEVLDACTFSLLSDDGESTEPLQLGYYASTANGWLVTLERAAATPPTGGEHE